MTFHDYWRNLCAANLGLLREDTRMTITVAQFRKSVRKAFEAGSGTAEAKKRAADAFGKLGKDNPFSNIFGGVM